MTLEQQLDDLTSHLQVQQGLNKSRDKLYEEMAKMKLENVSVTLYNGNTGHCAYAMNTLIVRLKEVKS